MGFSMPAEWDLHEATWLAWPHNPTDWPDKLDAICWVYGEMVRKISPGERIRMLVNSAAGEKTAQRYPTLITWTSPFLRKGSSFSNAGTRARRSFKRLVAATKTATEILRRVKFC